MHCRKCGAVIGRKDRLPDGRYRCPGCGTVYRINRKPSAAEKSIKKVLRLPFFRKPAYIAAGAALICILIVSCALIFRSPKADAPVQETIVPVETAAPIATEVPEEVPAIKPASVHFRAVGDIMCHKLQLEKAYQKNGTFNFDSQFAYVQDALGAADYTIGNLEMSISANGKYSSYPRFHTPETILDTLKDCGVDFLTMSNNHILDGYFKGLVKTVDEAEKRGFDHVGAYRTQEEADAPVIVNINGIKFGFLAYTTNTNGNEKHLDAETAAYCVEYLRDADIEGDVQELRDAGAEIVICLPHWGEEELRRVRTGVKLYAERMAKAGVDIILGSHPHVVHPVEMLTVDTQNGSKQVLVAWSLGNFISNMSTQYTDSGIILDFSVDRDENGNYSIHDVGYVPVFVWNTKGYFHVVCSGEYYEKRPKGMSDSTYDRMKKSAKEIYTMIGTDGIALLRK